MRIKMNYLAWGKSVVLLLECENYNNGKNFLFNIYYNLNEGQSSVYFVGGSGRALWRLRAVSC